MSLAVSFHVERHFNERVGTASCTSVGIVPSAKFLANEFGGFDLESTREIGWKARGATPVEASMSQCRFPGAADLPERGLEADPAGAGGKLGPSSPPTAAPTLDPAFSRREPQNHGVCFSELWWPIPLFQKTRFFYVQPRISMEIETSSFRGPLLTSPSHISIGESVPGLCSEERRYIYPVSWQVVPKELLHWTLSLQNVKHSGRRGFSQPGSDVSGAAAFLILGTNMNLSNLLLFFFFFFPSFSYSFLSV